MRKQISINVISLRNYLNNPLQIKGTDVESHERWSVLWLLFLSGFYSIALVPVFYLLELAEVANAFLFLTVSALLIFWYFYRSSNCRMAANLYGVATFTGFSYMAACTGGLDSPLLLYQLIAPIGTNLLSNKNTTKVWTIGALICILFLLLDRYIPLGFVTSVPPENSIIPVVGILSLLMYLLSIMWAYEKAKATFQEVIQDQNKDLSLVNEKIDKQKRAIEIRNNNILSSIQYAKTIQDAIMHHGRSLQSIFPESFIFFSPRDIVSGDFYWTDQRGDKKIVVAADCTGHGVPGAFMSLIGMYLLHSIVRESSEPSAEPSPDIILRKLRRAIHIFLNQDTSESRDGMDIAVCMIDKTEVRVASAKSPVYYIKQGELHTFKGDTLMVGGNLKVYKEEDFSLLSLPRQEVDYIFMCSDGFQDQFGGLHDRKYMKKQLKELLLRVALLNSSEKKAAIAREFEDWKGSSRQLDDVLVMGFDPR